MNNSDLTCQTGLHQNCSSTFFFVHIHAVMSYMYIFHQGQCQVVKNRENEREWNANAVRGLCWTKKQNCSLHRELILSWWHSHINFRFSNCRQSNFSYLENYISTLNAQFMKKSNSTQDNSPFSVKLLRFKNSFFSSLFSICLAEEKNYAVRCQK